MKLVFRAQEWLADRVSWVQYPNVRMVSPKRPSRPATFWTNRMPFGYRIMLVAACLLMLMILIPALIAVCMGIYAYLGASFGWL